MQCNILIWLGILRDAKEKNRLVHVLDNNFLVLVMKTENAARLLFKQITVHGARSHHHNLLLEGLALGELFLVLLFGRGDLVIERDETQITTLSGDQVIAEIKRQADPDKHDQVLAEQVILLDESLHPSNESRLSLWVKQKRDMNQRVVWKQTANKRAKRFF